MTPAARDKMLFCLLATVLSCGLVLAYSHQQPDGGVSMARAVAPFDLNALEPAAGAAEPAKDAHGAPAEEGHGQTAHNGKDLDGKPTLPEVTVGGMTIINKESLRKAEKSSWAPVGLADAIKQGALEPDCYV